MSEAEAQAMVTEPFESWGLDEMLPLPVESMIKDLVAKVGEGTAWAIEAEVGQDAWNRKINLGEEDDDEQPDDGPAGAAGLADGPEGPAVVVGDGADHQQTPDEG
jgi:hypothetical protein